MTNILYERAAEQAIE